MKNCAALLMLLLVVEPAFACCNDPGDLNLDMKSLARNANETFRGPRHIVVKNINPLRYDYTWVTVTTYGNTPDLWALLVAASGSSNPLSPSPAPAGKSPKPGPGPNATSGAGAGQPCPNTNSDTLTMTAELSVLNLGNDDLVANINSETTTVTNLHNTIKSLQDTITVTLQGTAAGATTAVKSAGSRLTALLSNSDSIIQTTGTLASSIHTLQSDATWQAAPQKTWPSGVDLDNARRDLRTAMDDLNSEKNRLPGVVVANTMDLTAYRSKLDDLQARIAQQVVKLSQSSQCDRDLIKALAELAQRSHENLRDAQVKLAALSGSVDQYLTTANQLSSILDDIKIDGDKYTAFVNAQQSLKDWDVRMSVVRDMPTTGYTIAVDPTCEYAFSRTKTVKVTLSQSDRMPGGVANANYDLGTMECASPFNVSVGVLLSFMTQREFGIQAVPDTPGSTNTTNQFVTTSDSSVNVQPIAMVSARLCEFNEKYALGAAFGIGANISGQNSGGSSASFLFGPTLSFFRAVYITPGLYIGRQTNLGGGYKVGQPVPPSVTTPPLQTSYKPAFGVSITFTKP